MALLNLNKQLNNLAQPTVNPRRLNPKNSTIRTLVILGIFLIGIVFPTVNIYLTSKQLTDNSRQLLTAVKQENLDQIKTNISKVKTSVKSINGYSNFFFWLNLIPFIGGYYSDVKHVINAVEYELEATEKVVEILEPFRNELGLTGQITAGQDRVAQVVKILDKVLPNLDQVEPLMKKAGEEMKDVDTSKYPEKIGRVVVKNKLREAKNFIVGADIAVTEGQELIRVLPDVLGRSQPKTYLLLFQNDKELRPTGGFITAFAFLQLDKGRLATTTVSDDIYRLDEKLLKVCLSKICPLTPPAPIIKYLPEVTGKPRTAWSMRDSNISPDLPTAAKEFERMYALLGEGLSFDGIIMIDTKVVEELIAITGPIDVFGTKYSAESDKRCDCPNVIYELEHYAEVAAKGENDRKAILGTLMQQILVRVLGSGTDQLPTFLDTGVRLASSKHIMYYMHDPEIEGAFSKLGWTGEIKDPEGDYLHINDANFAGGKSNLYVDEKVTVDLKSEDGEVRHKVTIEYKNPQAYNTWLNGILRDYVRVYVPKGSRLISSKGSDDPVGTQIDEGLNKTYFEAFITVRPQNSRILSFEYISPLNVSSKTWQLLIQKQPGSKNHHYTIKMNGSKKAEFDLTSDKQLKLSF